MSDLVCLECRKARVKCNGVFPCPRCVKMGLSCLPQHRKRGRPSKGCSHVEDFANTFRDWSAHLPSSRQARVASMVASIHYKERAHNPNFEGLKGVESLGDDNEIIRTLESLLHQAGSFPTEAEAEEQLLQFESWVPPDLLQLRSCCTFTFAATVFAYNYYGRYRYKVNTRFAELFESEEQAMMADHDVSSYKSTDLWADSDSLSKLGKASRSRALPHSLMHRVVSLDSYLEFTREAIQACVGTDDDVAKTDGIHEMETRSDKLLCHVIRYMWTAKSGAQGAYYMEIHPLPRSKYLTVESKINNAAPTSKGRERAAERVCKKESAKVEVPANISEPTISAILTNSDTDVATLYELCAPEVTPPETIATEATLSWVALEGTLPEMPILRTTPPPSHPLRVELHPLVEALHSYPLILASPARPMIGEANINGFECQVQVPSHPQMVLPEKSHAGMQDVCLDLSDLCEPLDPLSSSEMLPAGMLDVSFDLGDLYEPQQREIGGSDTGPSFISSGSMIGTGNGTGAMLSNQSLVAKLVSPMLSRPKFLTFLLPLLTYFQVHFLYGLQKRYTMPLDDMLDSTPDLWLKDGSWIYQRFFSLKVLLCAVCLLGCISVERVEWCFPHICTTSSGAPLRNRSVFCPFFESSSSSGHMRLCSVPAALRLQQAQEQSVRVMRISLWMLAVIILIVEVANIELPEGVPYHHNPTNCLRIIGSASFATVFSPSTGYWFQDKARWIMLWTIIPFQMLMYLVLGKPALSMCCVANLAAQTCTVNVVRIHAMSFFISWSGATHVQETLWVSAWFILAQGLEVVPQLVVVNATACAMICAKILAARRYYESRL